MQSDAVALDASPRQQLVESEVGQDLLRPPMPDLDQHLDKLVNLPVLFQQRPVKPTDLVILTIPIVVSALSAPNFVPHEQHRRTYGKQRDGEKIFDHAVAQPLDGSIVAGTFHAAVATQISTRTVAIILSIGFIVFRS